MCSSDLFGPVGGVPRFIERAAGPYLFDVDGRQYVDLICSWGPMILGHAHPAVVAAVSEALTRGTSFGAGQDVRWVREPSAQPLPDGLRLLEYLVDACEEEG